MAGSWGLNLIGFGAVMNALDDLSIELRTNAVYVVGPSAEYGVYQELGTRDMEPNPFLQPAVRDARRNMARIVKGAESGNEMVKQVALYVEKRAKYYATTGNPPGPNVRTGNLRASIHTERVR